MSGKEEQRESWEAYSDYRDVSNRVTQSIDDAVDAFAQLDQSAASGRKLNSERRAELRADILSAATMMRVELEAEADRGESYAEEILNKWQDSDDGDEEGWLSQFRHARRGEAAELPFLSELATDIRRAGYELGYLQAGRKEKTEDEGDADDAEVTAIIDGMTV